jgi:hypothetical protein
MKTNEKLFLQFQENSKEKDKVIEKSIDKLFELMRKVEEMVNRNINK